MSSILDQVMPPQQFVPVSVEEYFALQLAKRLADETALARYVRYAEHHQAGHLAHLCHRATRESSPAEAFHSSLMPTSP